MTPEELKRYTEEDVSRWSRLVRSAGIKSE